MTFIVVRLLTNPPDPEPGASGGRVDLIIGTGNTEEQSKVVGYTNDDQWERNREHDELLHRAVARGARHRIDREEHR
ncbi:MAG: hypothetical protein ABWZ42_11290 [Ilumatobacteraceae bacterium]